MTNQSTILEYFNPMMVGYIENCIYHSDITDNNEKANLIVSFLSQFGFEEVGCGTNRVVVKKDSSCVFKIALDKRGALDNDLEKILSVKLQPFATICIDNIGVISAQEMVSTMSKQDMIDNIDTVRKILFNVGLLYVVNDVGPSAFMNWGFRDSGEIVMLDYAYITPITSEMNFACKAKKYGKKKKCGGQLTYTKNFDQFVCTKCGAKFSISDIAAISDKDIELQFYNGNNSNIDESLYPQIESQLKESMGYSQCEDANSYDELGFYVGNNN